MRTSKLSPLLAIAYTIIVPITASSIIIDDFSTEPAQVTMSFLGSNPTMVADAAVLGGTRSIGINFVLGENAIAGANIAGSQIGVLINSAASMADAYFLYDTAGAGLNWNAVGYATSPFALDYWVEYEMQFLVTVTDYAAASWTWTSPVVGPDATGTMVSPELSVWQGAGINLGASTPSKSIWTLTFRAATYGLTTSAWEARTSACQIQAPPWACSFWDWEHLLSVASGMERGETKVDFRENGFAWTFVGNGPGEHGES